jgi:hypothetical protein
MAHGDAWPSLPLGEWQETYETLHRWTQVVGKIRMSLSPPQNHYWHVALYVNGRGLTTSPIPCGGEVFEIQFDFPAHLLDIWTSSGERRVLPLRAETVSSFYGRVMEALQAVGVGCAINTKPQEVADTTPFEEDHRPRAYDSAYVLRFWRILLSTTEVLQEFRSGFVGKCSPVHFFWGSFDLAHTRFSGRTAPPRKGVISGPSYSHEEYSAGFWPGGGAVDGPAFYAYTVPQPPGIEAAAIRPASAGWNGSLREFILMYDDVRQAEDPRQALREFLDSTYEAGARLAHWDRAALEMEVR